MKTINSIVCASSIAIAMLTSTVTMAGSAEQEAAVNNANSGTQIHRVSHALAASSSYQASGYKWDKQNSTDQNKSQAQWGQNSAVQSGNKWGNSTVSSESSKAVYATTSGNQWGIRSFAEQTGNRWGIRSFAEQTGNRWGIRSFAEQAGNRWGIRSFAEQAGNRWGIRSFAEQAGNRWGIRSFAEQAGNRWGIRSFAEQTGNRWGIR